MVRIGFSDKNDVIKSAAEELKKNTKHSAIIYISLLEALDALKNKKIDCLVGGHDISTGDFLKEIFKIIRPKGRVYSYSVLTKNNKSYYFADTAVNIAPTQDQLCELEEVLMRELKPYTDYFELARISYKTDNTTMQIDAALDPIIATKKGIVDSKERNVFIFPDINSANISYKLMQKLGDHSHIGPILLNVGYPISDLSRSADSKEIYNTAKYLADLTAKRLEK
ncbi:hypothetical protein J4423_02025 [Candidatus Pacearchaeota archaeon]|nr:hypothetical protein [Candidatus Pacearchaeota archaeon]